MILLSPLLFLFFSFFFFPPPFIFVLFPRKVEWILVSGSAETQSGQFISDVSGLTLSVD